MLLYCYVVIKLYAYVTSIVYHVLYYCCYSDTYNVIDNNNNVVVIIFVYNIKCMYNYNFILIIFFRYITVTSIMTNAF